MLERAVPTFRDDLLSIKSGGNLPVGSMLRSSKLILCDCSVINRILFHRVCHDLHHTVWWCQVFAFCAKKFHILSLLKFVVQNKNFFSTNNENHNLDTKQRNNLYLPQANLTIYQKGTYYSGIRIFNNLPLEIKNVAGNQKKFKIALKKFLHTYSFYTIEECLHRS